MGFTKIAVGVDLSSESELAVAQAMSLARRDGASVVLIHAGPVRSDDRARVEALRERLIGQGVDVSQTHVEGRADEAVTGAAHELGCDLIAVGTHGRTGVSRVLLGSVAEATVRSASSSVLVARGAAAAAAGGFRRIVVGVEFAPTDDLVIALAIALAAPGAEIHLVHAWALPPPVAPDDMVTIADLRGELDVDARRKGAALLARVRDAHPGVTISLEISEVPAQEVLVARAAALGADLIAVGSHGRRGLRRFVLGSVAEMVVRCAPCSVVVAREERVL